MTPPCPHRPACPGCPRYGAERLDPGGDGALAALAREHGLPPPAVTRGAATGFRHRARLAVRGRAGAPKIGIFGEGSHRVVDIPRCPIHHPLVNEVAAALRRAMVETGATPYSDAAHRGLVRYLQVVVERRSQTAQVVVVTCSGSPEPALPLLDALRTRLGERLHSLFWNGNPERVNTILGARFERIAGEEMIEEMVAGARVFYPPGAFGQSHLALAEEIARGVQAAVPDGARVLDLYAGAGPLGLGVAPRARSVALNEISEGSLAGLERGIMALPGEIRGRVRVLPGPASRAARSVAEADVVIADPPRKGLDPAVRSELARARPARLVYVACGLPAFLDDARTLTEGGAFRLASLSAFDLFPYTDHVEVLAIFDRSTDAA